MVELSSQKVLVPILTPNHTGPCLTTRAFISYHTTKILALTKWKAFADKKFSVAEMMIFVFHRVGNIMGKGENAGYQHFLLFPQCF